ncbi:hypothetical protein BKA56DRAFT_648506 [Ilyonectria sp. MPI-CAGE-AT-0026]|nr:hypothetical protein BKA56DRAFT_648506 [Ilyonectria sp. MPI-CAGE-AT-0026]
MDESGVVLQDESGLFQCGSCKRRYKRLDHLARHTRSHTQSRPYKCSYCSKAFSRADVLKRHVSVHGPSTSRDRQGPVVGGNAPIARGRVVQACQACAVNHLRCTDLKPCSRCEQENLICIWDRSTDSEVSQMDVDSNTASRKFGDIDENSNQRPPVLDPTFDDPDLNGIGNAPANPIQLPSALPSDQVHNSNGNISFPLEIPELNNLCGQWTPMRVSEMDFSTHLELSDIDLRFLDEYNTNIPFEYGSFSADGTNSRPDEQGPLNQYKPVGMSSESFAKSYWRFCPATRDSTRADDPGECKDQVQYPETPISLDRRVTCKRLSTAARDRILMTLVGTCRPENMPKAFMSFPSVELLDTLLQFYLTSPVSRADSFIHSATFDPNEQSPELLAAMISSASILTIDPALAKLGFAFLEHARVAIVGQWEKENDSVRDLELAQAFTIVLEVDLWSGHHRKVEVTERFFQPFLTLLRRSGKLRQSFYPRITVSETDEGEQLQALWRKWSLLESFKRLVFRVIRHDTNASMSLQVNPLISHAEMLIPLPESHCLWQEKTACEWKSAMLAPRALNPDVVLTVADYADDLEGACASDSIADTEVVSTAFLSCVWGFAWEHIQLKLFQRHRPRRWNALIMASRHDEIIKMLNQFQVSFDVYASFAPEVLMKLELIFMHMDIPLEDCQVFAGMQGPEEARKVYPTIREWHESEAARRAIWHAGQIIRIARSMPEGTIRGPSPIMVYHASLALWVYGLLSTSKNKTNQGGDSRAATSGPHSQPVWLDSRDNPSVQRFLQLGSGQPCLRNPSKPDVLDSDDSEDVYLSSPEKTMGAVIGMLRDNFVGTGRPLLIEQTIQLMTGLQNMSRSHTAS